MRKHMPENVELFIKDHGKNGEIIYFEQNSIQAVKNGNLIAEIEYKNASNLKYERKIEMPANFVYSVLYGGWIYTKKAFCTQCSSEGIGTLGEYECKDCDLWFCAKHIYIYRDINNWAITRNDPELCLKCYGKRDGK